MVIHDCLHGACSTTPLKKTQSVLEEIHPWICYGFQINSQTRPMHYEVYIDWCCLLSMQYIYKKHVGNLHQCITLIKARDWLTVAQQNVNEHKYHQSDWPEYSTLKWVLIDNLHMLCCAVLRASQGKRKTQERGDADYILCPWLMQGALTFL